MADLFKEEVIASQENTEDNILESKIEELKTKPIDELAKGKAHADQFIEFLKSQNKEMKDELDKTLAELNKRASAEQVLEQLKKTTIAENQDGATTSGLDAETIKSLVEKSLEEQQVKKTAQQNIVMVDAKIKEMYGEKAKEFVSQKSKELGLSLEELGALAQRSPNAFFNLVGVNTTAMPTPAITHSNIRQDAMPSKTTTPGTFKYYEELRKADKRAYFSPQVQSRMFKDREKLGADFYK